MMLGLVDVDRKRKVVVGRAGLDSRAVLRWIWYYADEMSLLGMTRRPTYCSERH